MERPAIFVVGDPSDTGEWVAAIRAAGGSAVDARAVQSLSSAAPDASLVVVLSRGPAFASAPGAMSFSPSTIIAIGPLAEAPAPENAPGAADGVPVMSGSIVPMWHTEWYMSLRRALSTGRIGAVRRISITCATGTGMSPGDPHSPVSMAIMFPTGLFAGAAIEWTSGSPGPEGFSAEGLISGTGISVSLRAAETGSAVSAEVEGSSGRASIRFDESTANVVISAGGEAPVTVFSGRFEPLAGAAGHVVASALAKKPRMMPVTAGAAFMSSSEGLARVSGIAGTATRGQRGGFEPNTFRGRGGPGAEVKVFVEGRCNMSCPFCFSPTAQPPADTVAGFSAHFAALKDRGVGSVILSGGEPTINRDLVGIVKAAVDAGIGDITLETNAVLVDAGLARDLAAAGLRRALVSLHSLDPAVAAAMTGVQGLLPRTMAGISFLLDAGIQVSVNFVITAINWRDLPSTARWVSRLDPRPEMMIISSMAATGDAAAHPELLARVADAAPAIREAVVALRESGVTAVIPGQCGLPACILPDMPELFSTESITREDPEWTACAMEGRYHAPQCAACRSRRSCYGIWKAYAERFGTDEFRPLR